MGQQHRTLAVLRLGACTALFVVVVSGSVPLATTQGPAPTALPRLEWSVAGAGRGTPAALDETTYFLTRGHQIVALSLVTGAEKWKRSTGGTGPDTLGSRIVISGDIVIAGDVDLVGFDRHTGERRWTFGTAERRHAGLYLGDAADGIVYAGSPAGFLQAVDVENGQSRWVRRLTAGTVFTPAVIAPNRVAVGFADRRTPRRGGVAVFDAATGDQLWRYLFLPWTHVGADAGAAGIPIVCATILVVGSEEGSLYGLDRTSGQVRWVIPPLGGRPDRGRAPVQDYRPVACVGDTLIAASLTGQVVAYDTETRRERWRRAPLPASVAFGLAVDDETVFVPYLSGHLVALALVDGSERWRTGGPSAGFVWTPLVHDSRLLVAGSGAGFMAFRR